MPPLQLNRAKLVVLTSVTLVALLFTLLAGNMLQRYQRYQQEIDTMQPKIARLRGLAESEPVIRQAEQQLRQQLANDFYPVTLSEQDAANQLQRTVSELLQRHQLNVGGTQLLPAVLNERYMQLYLQVSATADLAKLEAFLDALQQARPVIRVADISVQPVRSRPGQPVQALTIKLRLYALRSLL